MDFTIAVLASIAIAGGIGAVIGILVGGGRRPRVATPAVAEAATAAPRSPGVRVSVTSVAPKGYIGMIERQIMLAGRPPGWTVDKILLAKPVLAVPSHVEQLVSCWTEPILYSLTKRAPRSESSVGRSQFMLKT